MPNVSLAAGGETSAPHHPPPTASVRVAALAAVIGHIFLLLFPRFWHALDFNTLTLLGLVAVSVLGNGQVAELGFRKTPLQGWWYWCRFAVGSMLAVALLILACAAIAFAAGWEIPLHRKAPRDAWTIFLFMCVYTPLLEEIVYRSLLTVAVHPTLGDKGTILVSGLVFAAVHWIYGIPSPENQVGGFILAWAFIRSQTILVPLFLHSAGNFFALLFQIAAWYLV